MPPDRCWTAACRARENTGMTNDKDEQRGGAWAEARRHIRRYSKGVLRIGDRAVPTRFVIDGRDGSVVYPCGEDEAENAVLSVPDDGFDEMGLLLESSLFAVRFDEVKDRHQAYHGDAGSVDWFKARVESVKWKGEVFSGDELLGANPLRADEPALVRTLNADRDRLREVTRLLTGVKPEEGVCVGVDPIGMDVRTRVGVIRVEWPREIESLEQAHKVVGALLADGLGEGEDEVG